MRVRVPEASAQLVGAGDGAGAGAAHAGSLQDAGRVGNHRLGRRRWSRSATSAWTSSGIERHAWRRAQGARRRRGDARRARRRAARARGGARRAGARDTSARGRAAGAAARLRAARCAGSASTCTPAGCSTSSRRWRTWTSAGGTTCSTCCRALLVHRHEDLDDLRSRLRRVLAPRRPTAAAADSAAQDGPAVADRRPPARGCRPPRNAGRRRAGVEPDDDAIDVPGVERRRGAGHQGLRRVLGRRAGGRARGASSGSTGSPACGARGAGCRDAGRASTCGGRWRGACAPAATWCGCRGACAGCGRARSSCCATSAGRWRCTRGCSCTSPTPSRAATAASRRSCSRRG